MGPDLLAAATCGVGTSCSAGDHRLAGTGGEHAIAYLVVTISVTAPPVSPPHPRWVIAGPTGTAPLR
ncbi:MAG TPA: hypothetical protein VK280_08745 [Streptosporangiaceae bacterium]|nr:hypothetical protein [Streptosporangiaceae bacterium]